MNNAAAALQLEDALRCHAPCYQVAKGKNIPAQAAAPVYIRFGPNGAHGIHCDVSSKVLDSSAERITAAFAGNIERVGDLRITEFDAGAPAQCDPEVNAPGSSDTNHCAEGGQAPREVDILLPTVKRQAFVERNLISAHRGKANRHVATVSGKYRRDAIAASGLTFQDCARLLDGEARSADAVGNHHAGCNNDSVIHRHMVFDRSKVSSIGQEIVVEEYHDIRAGRGGDHRVALVRQPRFAKHYLYACHDVGSAFNIGRSRSAHDHAVWLACLTCKLTQRLPQDGSPPDSGDPNGYSEIHECISQDVNVQTTVDIGDDQIALGFSAPQSLSESKLLATRLDIIVQGR